MPPMLLLITRCRRLIISVRRRADTPLDIFHDMFLRLPLRRCCFMLICYAPHMMRCLLLLAMLFRHLPLLPLLSVAMPYTITLMLPPLLICRYADDAALMRHYATAAPFRRCRAMLFRRRCCCFCFAPFTRYMLLPLRQRAARSFVAAVYADVFAPLRHA